MINRKENIVTKQIKIYTSIVLVTHPGYKKALLETIKNEVKISTSTWESGLKNNQVRPLSYAKHPNSK